jgi:hypothetical protein
MSTHYRRKRKAERERERDRGKRWGGWDMDEKETKK